jgi:glycosyltransferase involved in cell wall biosynthesis
MTFSKRIAFVISDQHLIPHGGIGQFAKGFSEMARNLNWCVDLIMDKKPRYSDFLGSIQHNISRIITPDNDLSYKGHTEKFAFSDSYNLEKSVNFRESMMKAFQSNLYDMILINTPEALLSVYSLGIQEYIPVVFYTHNENLVFKNNTFKGVFNDYYDNFFSKLLNLDGLIVGTQTERNVEELSNATHLPMPMPERGLLEYYTGEKSGVLFIGRWEERKNPKVFIDMIKETGLPAKVLTNKTGEKKFKTELEAIGAKYDIKAEVIGQEKVDFIRSSRIFFMPSKSESYGFALFESLGHMPCVVLKEYEWHDNFSSRLLEIMPVKEVSFRIKALYESKFPHNNDNRMEYVRSLDKQTNDKWVKLVDDFVPKTSKSNAAKINERDDIFYDSFIEKNLNRYASSEDVISVLSNRHKFKICYTKDRTWLSKTGNLPIHKNTNQDVTSFFT